MVATKISEVAGKGLEFFGLGSDASAVPSSSSSSSWTSDYYHNANDSMQYAAETTYATMTRMLSSLTYKSDSSRDDFTNNNAPMMENLPPPPSGNKPKQKNSLLTPDLLSMFKNPYIRVPGGGRRHFHPPSSMNIVRNLLNVVPVESDVGDDNASETSNGDSISENQSWMTAKEEVYSSSPSETASRLAEGTIRAFRDIALDEAVELHEALRFWSYRWERPLLSWLEAGPTGKRTGAVVKRNQVVW
jgi:hypothetical protein